ncbi:formate dehydrogenase accessory sulfurtransferase FdhD [Methanocorpusculum sp. MG]|uniref:Formate dehydrogenase accessory sulfurtransferase FdhD n=1 Tax=Methanocorpusculum petauri TaxID=3002863 RepID=A0ABT4IFS7_9EURY|nr:formate dehydrogenase accessory sulfurtransferase FdhD [Methanocorpusculum petauri]MCZ0860586.1 formate dehydrogenase accessory sulfurtransferase FdhD [Methanocorpusculum petauri]MCZ9311982.1 formate dehydrogenase accessory sulfurtransferase FdhD [Methanocorpusculum sp.]MDE2444217.1 formate dehydrogenase accessory sulfurtransferase FdhD [Methanocorpusculum sp.]
MKNLKNETPVQIIINGRAAMTIMTSAEDPTDLVVGQLYTERVIETYADISSVHIDGPQTSVVTANPFEILLSRKTVLAGCGGASSFLDSGKLGDITSDLVVSEQQLSRSTEYLPKTNWHSAALFTEDATLLTAAEDLTSQNTADRIIGWGLAHNIDFSRTYLLFSGNIVAETVRKTVIANIPLVATAAEVTSAAVAAADNTGLALYRITGNTIVALGRISRCTP